MVWRTRVFEAKMNFWKSWLSNLIWCRKCFFARTQNMCPIYLKFDTFLFKMWHWKFNWSQQVKFCIKIVQSNCMGLSFHSGFKNYDWKKKYPLVTKHVISQNHQQLPKTTHNQMVWNFHISDRKIFSSFYLILQFLKNNLHNWLTYF